MYTNLSGTQDFISGEGWPVKNFTAVFWIQRVRKKEGVGRPGGGGLHAFGTDEISRRRAAEQTNRETILCKRLVNDVVCKAVVFVCVGWAERAPRYANTRCCRPAITTILAVDACVEESAACFETG